jgi:hypothetical protein
MRERKEFTAAIKFKRFIGSFIYRKKGGKIQTIKWATKKFYRVHFQQHGGFQCCGSGAY